MPELDPVRESAAIKKALDRERKARKLAETLLEDRAAELYLANQELDATIAILKKSNLQLLQSEKMASVGQLAAGVAHEINNPVGFISSNLGTLREYIADLSEVIETQQKCIGGVSELAEKAPANDSANHTALLDELNNVLKKVDLEFLLLDVRDLLDESIDGVKRIRKIVADLSDFSRVNSPDYKVANINTLLEKTISVAWNELKYKAEVVREFGQIPEVKCNSGKLIQVFLNLVINASHAIETQGVVTITTKQLNDTVIISISDTGTGIAEDKLASIFDPFFTTKKAGKGTGLGLHIVNSVIESHQGKIEVESTLGVGTTFNVILPIAGPKIEDDGKNDNDNKNTESEQ